MDYLKKKKQITEILTSKPIQFQDPEDELCLSYYDVYMSESEAQEMAEIILSKFGLNKPEKS